MHAVQVVLIIAAVICLFIAALGKPDVEGKVNLGWMGLALWATAIGIGIVF